VIDEQTRFAAVDDEIMCRRCAELQDPEWPAGDHISKGTDPTISVLGKSKLHKKRLVDWNVNVATGCSHGCAMCYVPATPQVTTRKERISENAGGVDASAGWGRYVLYRDDAPEKLRRELAPKARRGFENFVRTEQGRGIVGLSFHTDCYQDRRAADITRACIRELVEHDRYVRVLTRSPIVTRDRDLFVEHSDRVTVGMSIPTLDDEAGRAIETAAPKPTARLAALRELASSGVRTFVSMGPTLPTASKADLRALLEALSTVAPDVIYHEPINPAGDNFERTVEAAVERGATELADAIRELNNDDEWREYALQQIRWVHELGRELELPVYCWPDTKLTSGPWSEYAEWWRDQESPEPFAGREVEWEIPPPLPSTAPKPRTELSEFADTGEANIRK
jgi:DNA repair photolyase